MIKLAKPSKDYKESFLEAVREYSQDLNKEGYNLEFLSYRYGDLESLKKDFPGFVKRINNRTLGKGLPEGFVPETIFWLVDGKEYIGQVSIRHKLNENLLKIGGHIGYDIRPSKRGRGYGKKILELALIKAKEMGIEDVLITCDLTNVPSKKIIEDNGGVLENVIPQGEGKPDKMRFWIKV